MPGRAAAPWTKLVLWGMAITRRTMVWALGALGIAGVAALGVACATGSVEGDPLEEGTGTGDEDAAPRKKYDAGGPTVDVDAGSDANVPVGDGGGGDGGGGDGGAPSCAATNTCMAATDLGTVSGDTGSGTLSKQGSVSTWLTVRVTENDSSVIGKSLKARITLNSPAGTNYDLYVYLPGSDTRACGAPTHTATGATGSDVVNVDWGEGTVANGSDDDRTVSVEVRHASGPCDAAHQWSLTVQGNP